MQCKVCKCEMRITNGKIVTEGDNGPDTPTKVYRELEYRCRAKQCPEYDKVQAVQRVELT